MENREYVRGGYHLAGIVPISGQPLDFNFPWNDCLQPIADNYLAVEKAVFDCVAAGCSTIWVVGHKETQPLVRHRIGDYITDPVEYAKDINFRKYPEKQTIPIYYVPLHPKNLDRRDSYSWSIIEGIEAAYKVSKKISKWIIPDRYFVSFPYGLYDPVVFYKCRKWITKRNPFYFTYNGESFKDNLYLPFTLNNEDFLKCRAKFRRKETRAADINLQPLPKDEAHSGRFFQHGFVFDDVDTAKAQVVDLSWYYDISSWEKLKNWLASEKKLDRPSEVLISYGEWNLLGKDNEEE